MVNAIVESQPPVSMLLVSYSSVIKAFLIMDWTCVAECIW